MKNKPTTTYRRPKRARSAWDSRGFSFNRKRLPPIPPLSPESEQAVVDVNTWFKTHKPILQKSMGVPEFNIWWMEQCAQGDTMIDIAEHLEHLWVCPHCSEVVYIENTLHTPPRVCPICESFDHPGG